MKGYMFCIPRLLNQSYRVFMTATTPCVFSCKSLYRESLQMTSEPPLRGRMRSCCAAKFWVDLPVMAKIVFAWHRARPWIKLTAGMAAVDVQRICGSLPEASRLLHSHVSTDVNVFHFQALSSPEKINNVEVFEAATNIVSEIHAVGWVATCGSPVSGVTLQRPHSVQTQAVEIPVQGVLVDWIVVLKGSLHESG